MTLRHGAELCERRWSEGFKTCAPCRFATTTYHACPPLSLTHTRLLSLTSSAPVGLFHPLFAYLWRRAFCAAMTWFRTLVYKEPVMVWSLMIYFAGGSCSALAAQSPLRWPQASLPLPRVYRHFSLSRAAQAACPCWPYYMHAGSCTCVCPPWQRGRACALTPAFSLELAITLTPCSFCVPVRQALATPSACGRQ